MDKDLDTSQLDEFEKEKEKQAHIRRRNTILLFIIMGFLLFGGVAMGTISVIQANQVKTQITELRVLIDPMLVTGSSEQHISGGAQFVFGQESPNTTSTQVNKTIGYGEYIYYRYEFTNSGQTEIDIMLNLDMEQKINAKITYKIDEGEINLAPQQILNFVSTPDSTKSVIIFIKIDDPDEDTYIRGSLILSLTEKGV